MSNIAVQSTAVNHTTMGGMLSWQALYRADALAVVCEDQTRTWRELNTAVNRCANGLRELGVTRGESIAIMLSNRIEVIELYLACAKIGVAATPINYQFAAAETAHVINDSNARLVIHDDAKEALIAGLVQSSSINIGQEQLINVDGPDSQYGQMQRSASPHEPRVDITGDETFFIGYTSGTTGFPKGCLHKHRSFVDCYKLSRTIYSHGAASVVLIPGPLFHEAPTLFTLAQLFHGGAVILLKSFDPETALREVERHRCTAIGFAVSTMLDRMFGVDSVHDTSSVKDVIVGGAPLHEGTISRTTMIFPSAEIHEFYGATELGLVTNIRHRDEGLPGSCGRPVPGMSVAIFDDEGRPLTTNKKGLVYVTPLLMEGYLNNEAATAESTLIQDGVRWFTIGDVGYLDHEGYLHLVDRKSHMIISGGENVYPAEVEAALISHPDVNDLAVIGLPDDQWGETVAAVVVTENDSLNVDELREFLDGKLARYKWPRHMIAVDELPRTPSGKVQKHRLKATGFSD